MVQMIKPPKGAHIQVGDMVNRAGIYTKPGVVIEKNEDGTVTIDTDAEAVKEYHRHANTTGLTPEDKERFNGIMDDIMDMSENSERLNDLQAKIDELRLDPESKKLMQALKNEQSSLIRMARELPRVFTYDSGKI
jgi:Na+/phosphate symporter